MSTEQQSRPPDPDRLTRLRLQAPYFHPEELTDEQLMTLAKAGEGGSY